MNEKWMRRFKKTTGSYLEIGNDTGSKWDITGFSKQLLVLNATHDYWAIGPTYRTGKLHVTDTLTKHSRCAYSNNVYSVPD